MPDRNRKARPEFEIAWYTKELGRPMQRKMLTQQLALLSGDAAAGEARHGEDGAAEVDAQLPPEDRAG